MIPISLLATQKLASLLTNNSALLTELTALSQGSGVSYPVITATQVVLSSASPDLGDKNVQLTYPRVCIYSSGMKNTLAEKFRSFSGFVSVTAEIWASANLISETDQWIHFYVQGVAEIIQENVGDWGDGLFFSGAYDVQIQGPKVGGVGFVQSAKLTLSLNVSQN